MSQTSSTSALAAETKKPGKPRARWSPLAWAGAIVFTGWVVVAIVGTFYTPYPPGHFVDSWNVLGPMTADTLLGTDYLGRDVLSRIMAGAKYTVGMPLLTAALALFFGLLLGIFATLVRPSIDTALSWFMDTVNSLPSTIFAMVAVAGFGSSLYVLIVVITLLYIPSAYRNTRSAAINISRMDFVDVARVRGEGNLYLIFREILPNIRSHGEQRRAWKDAAQARIARDRAEAMAAAQLRAMLEANPSGQLGRARLNDPASLKDSGLI